MSLDDVGHGVLVDTEAPGNPTAVLCPADGMKRLRGEPGSAFVTARRHGTLSIRLRSMLGVVAEMFRGRSWPRGVGQDSIS